MVALASSDDGRLLLAAGADGHLKMWNAIALERDVAVRPVQEIKLYDKLKKLKMLRGTKSVCIALGKELQIRRVDRPLETGAQPLVKVNLEQSGRSWVCCGPDLNLLCCVGTELCYFVSREGGRSCV